MNEINSHGKLCIFNDIRQRSKASGTLKMVTESYGQNIQKIVPFSYPQPNWVRPEGIVVLESTPIKFRTSRLPFGYSHILVVSAYIPEWDTKRQNTWIFQLLNLIEEATYKYQDCNKPHILLLVITVLTVSHYVVRSVYDTLTKTLLEAKTVLTSFDLMRRTVIQLTTWNL